MTQPGSSLPAFILALTFAFSHPAYPITQRCQQVIMMAQCAQMFRSCDSIHEVSLPCQTLCKAVTGDTDLDSLSVDEMTFAEHIQSLHSPGKSITPASASQPSDGTYSTTSWEDSHDTANDSKQSIFDLMADSKSVCTLQDLRNLKAVKFDIKSAFDCDNPDRWSIPTATPIASTEPVMENEIRLKPDQYCAGGTTIPNTPMAGRCEVYTGSVCRHIFTGRSKQIYLGPGLSQNYIENEARKFIPILNYFSHPFDLCSHLLLTQYCLSAFPMCGPQITGLNRHLPETPCKSLCLDIYNGCPKLNAFFRSLNINLPDCNGTLEATSKCRGLTPLPNFEEEDYYRTKSFKSKYIDDTYSGAVACTSRAHDAQTVDFEACPAPLITVNSNDRHLIPTINDGSCTEPCPPMHFTNDQYRQIDRFSESFGIISLVSSVLTLLTFAIAYSFKRAEQRYVLLIAIGSFIYTLFMWLSLRLRDDVALTTAHVMCKSPSQYHSMSGFPIAQGIVIIIFTMTTACLFLSQVTDILLKVAYERKYGLGSPSAYQKEAVITLFSLGFPLCSLIPLLITQSIGGDNYVGLGFGFPEQARKGVEVDYFFGAQSSDFIFYYFPLLVVVIAGLILLIILTVKITRRSMWSSLPKGVIRLMIAMTGVGGSILGFLALRADIENTKDPLTTAQADYIFCLVVLKPLQAVDSCAFNHDVSLAKVHLMYFFLYLPPIVLFFTYIVFNRDVLLMWKYLAQRLFGCCTNGCKRPRIFSHHDLDEENDFYPARLYQIEESTFKQKIFPEKPDYGVYDDRDYIDEDFIEVVLPPGPSSSNPSAHRASLPEISTARSTTGSEPFLSNSDI